MNLPHVLCIDVGRPRNIGWSASGDQRGCAAELDGALKILAEVIAQGGKAALGFEAPLWTPIRENLFDITRIRGGLEQHSDERRTRPWSAGGGAYALTASLGLMPYCLRVIARHHGKSPIKTTVDLTRFQSMESGLLIWEAFISGNLKTAVPKAEKPKGCSGHVLDAWHARRAFEDGWPKLQTEIEIADGDGAMNLAAAASLRVGLDIDADELALAPIVLGVRKPG